MQVVDAAPATRVVVADGRSTGPRRASPPERLAVRFAVGSTIAVALLVAVGHLVGGRLAEHQVLEDAQHRSRVIGRVLITPQLTPELLRGDPERVQALDELIEEQLIPETTVRRLKVWSPGGRIIYSNDPREIGRTFPLSADAQAVLSDGRTRAKVTDLGEDEHRFERGMAAQLLEVYSPIETAAGDPVLFEAYLSVEAIKSQRQTVYGALGVIAVAGIAIFVVFQIAFGLANVRWLRRQRRRLEQRAQEASEQERRRVARDLHDGVVQELVGAAYVIDGAVGALDRRDPAAAGHLLAGASGSLRGSIQGLRSMMIQIYPPTLRERGLAGSLTDLAQPLQNRGVVVELDLDEELVLPEETEQVVYRCTQEALRNVLLHARADLVSVGLHAREGAVVLTVRDDGVGMPTVVTDSPMGHLGLRSLRDLAVECRGVLSIETAPGKGTEIRLELPS